MHSALLRLTQSLGSFPNFSRMRLCKVTASHVHIEHFHIEGKEWCKAAISSISLFFKFISQGSPEAISPGMISVGLLPTWLSHPHPAVQEGALPPSWENTSSPKT
jgi:hypothetical protein